MVARFDGDGSARESHAFRIQRFRTGFGGRALDNSGSARRGCSRGSVDGGAVHAIPLAAGVHLRGKDALRHAPEVWWSRRTEVGRKELGAARRLLQSASSLELRTVIKRNLVGRAHFSMSA